MMFGCLGYLYIIPNGIMMFGCLGYLYIIASGIFGAPAGLPICHPYGVGGMAPLRGWWDGIPFEMIIGVL